MSIVAIRTHRLQLASPACLGCLVSATLLWSEGELSIDLRSCISLSENILRLCPPEGVYLKDLFSHGDRIILSTTYNCVEKKNNKKMPTTIAPTLISFSPLEMYAPGKSIGVTLGANQ